MAAPYESTTMTTNLARVARMILGPCKDILCDLLTKKITPPELRKKVQQFLNNLSKQRRHSPISKEQKVLIDKGNYSEFDISLLYYLLRNFCGIPEHSNRWGEDPCPNDRSESANIERIRIVRNKWYGHVKTISVPEMEFQTQFSHIYQIVSDLQNYTGTSISYTDTLTKIKLCSMDPEGKKESIDRMMAVQQLQEKMANYGMKIENLENANIPPNVKEIYDQIIANWKDDDKVFLETHNFQAMLEKVKKQPYVTFVGVSGSGKTATVRHIALLLREKGYEILPITDIHKLEDYCNPKKPQVFVLDDVVGTFGLDTAEFNLLCKYKNRIIEPSMANTKVIMTCRGVVFRNDILSDTFLSKKENVVLLHSEENALTDQDKCNLLSKYNLNSTLLCPNILSRVSKMFPVLCKLFANKEEFRALGSRFFISPVECILSEFSTMQRCNRMQYASLVLLLSNRNKLSEEDIRNNHTGEIEQMKCDVLEECKVGSMTDGFEIIGALKEMEGTYTQKIGSHFVFIHDFMFESLAYHIGQHFPEIILRYMSSDYIAHYIKLETQNDEQHRIKLCITLNETKYKLLGERLFRDVTEGELYTVFENEALKNPSVNEGFIELMSKKPYSDLHAIFLSELKDIVPDTECLKNGNFDWITHGMLINERSYVENGEETVKTSLRAISWVVYHGHHKILSTLINKTTEETGNVSAIFQNSHNKHENSLDNNENNSDIELEDSAIAKSDCILKRIFKFFMLCSDWCVEPKGEKIINFSMTHRQNKEEPVSVEQCRLLCLACLSGDINTVDLFLKHVKEDAINNTQLCDERSFWGMNPLAIACSSGSIPIVRSLIKANVDVNKLTGVCFPLVIACRNGYTQMVHELIEAGADVNAKHKDSPLIAACRKGHLEVVELLINANADINLECESVTPVGVAYEQGHMRVVNILLSNGANNFARIEFENPIVIAGYRGGMNIDTEIIPFEEMISFPFGQ